MLLSPLPSENLDILEQYDIYRDGSYKASHVSHVSQILEAEEAPPWVKENRGWTHEEAEGFKEKVALLGKGRGKSKLADIAETNLSCSGILPGNEQQQKAQKNDGVNLG